MFTHVMVGSSDLERSRRFYDATMQALEYQASEMAEGSSRFFYGDFGRGALGVGTPANGEPASHANGGTVGLRARDKDQVHAWHETGLANGGSCEGPPGLRQGGGYGAYLRDPDGNKLCAYCAG
jgi:catechol 2,3-dioxygenase-like lactoylglutathione lyase family enzyme